MANLLFQGNSYEVCDDVRDAIELVTHTCGATAGYASGHAVGARVVFVFPNGQEIQIAFNKRDLVIVLRDRSADGRSLSKLLPANWIKKVYPRDGNAGQVLMSGKAKTLRPSATNPVLRLQLHRDELCQTLALYLGSAGSC